MNIIKNKKIFFAISLLVMIPGIISLLLFGLKLSIDFTGGSKIEYQISNIKFQISNTELQKLIKEKGVDVGSIQTAEGNRYIVRTKPIDQKKYTEVTNALKNKYKDLKEISFQTVGPTIGKETTVNAVKSVVFASVLIIFYIAWSFRKVPKPASSWRFGVCAIVALLHDVLVVIGVFSLLGYFLSVEIDSLFVTALLTIIGFSVHDTIVVFDRIRENLRRMPDVAFPKIVNESILQTMVRSLNTSFTTLLVLFTLFLFGGESTKWFMVALIVGITSGTYSSIFNAAPLLVVWHEWNTRGKLS
ncbi:MAG: protein translocase subunit SecF [Candidatus Levybacteria bacterium]|nr:protein translocase subunit SecF [Candidatus Levybacteria bacterium]